MDELAPSRSIRVILWMAGSAGVVGVLGLVGMALAARWLGASGYAAFAVVWGVYFGIGSVFGGFQQEVTRSATVITGQRAGGRPLIWKALSVVVPVALVGGWVAHQTLDDLKTSAVLAVGLVGFGLLTFVLAMLAARAQWRALALLLVADATLRAMVIWVCTMFGSDQLVPIAVVSGSVLWAGLLVVPLYARTLKGHGSDEWWPFLRRCVWGLLGAGLAGLVVAGLPMLVALSRPGELSAQLGVILAATTWVRSGLLLLVYGLRPVVFRHFLVAGTTRTHGGPWLAVGLGASLYVGAVAVGAPPALRLLLGEEFAVSGTTCALLGIGAGGIALMVVSGLQLLARDRQVWAALGWFAALVGTVVTLVALTPLESALVHASWVGPWCGVAVHAVVLRLPNETVSKPTA